MTTTEPIERHQKAANDLKARVRGPVLEPGTPATTKPARSGTR